MFVLVTEGEAYPARRQPTKPGSSILVHLLPVAERIHAAITAVRIPAIAGDIAVTLSIGIAEVGQPTQDESVAQVISRADEAMYAAKRAGRNGSATYLAARPGTGPG